MDASGKQDITELVFPATTGALEQQFRLKWFPLGASVTVATTTVTGATPFVHHTSSDEPGGTIDDPWGEKAFNIRPDVLTQGDLDANPFLDRHSEVKFSVTDGGGATGTIRLRQFRYNTVAEVKSYYILGGGTHSFTVRSNTEWKIDRVDNNFGIENISLQSGGNNTTTGQQVTFTLKHDNTKNGQIAKIILVDPTNKMGEVEVPIKGISCGLGGAEVNKTIGTKSYKTHAYGTGADQRCWMVQNSEEGTTYSATVFGRDRYGTAGTITNGYDSFRNQPNGYYYTQPNAPGACPAGWALPAMAEITILSNAATADTPGIGKWWTGSTASANKAFAGFYGTDNIWYYFSAHACWWGEASGVYYSANSTSMGPGTGGDGAAWFAVRCVQRY
jgi:hypothetical protein